MSHRHFFNSSFTFFSISIFFRKTCRKTHWLNFSDIFFSPTVCVDAVFCSFYFHFTKFFTQLFQRNNCTALNRKQTDICNKKFTSNTLNFHVIIMLLYLCSIWFYLILYFFVAEKLRLFLHLCVEWDEKKKILFLFLFTTFFFRGNL